MNSCLVCINLCGCLGADAKTIIVPKVAIFRTQTLNAHMQVLREKLLKIPQVVA